MTPPVAPIQETARTPIISFLIPLYNGLKLTRATLRTLEATVDLTPHEVILIDDASTDGTKDFTDALPSPPYRVIHNATQSGYATGMNRGVAASRGEVLCLLNNDLEFTLNWLPPMLAVFETKKNVGIVGNVQISLQTCKYDHMGVVFGNNGAPIHFGKHFLFRPFHGVTPWKAVTAACCLVRRKDFLAAGMFDEGYKNGGEDVDLCLTLGKMGFEHFVVNESVIFHHVSPSAGRHDHNSKNAERLLGRWRESIQSQLTPSNRRRFAWNYVLRFLTQPWRYNGYKLWNALLTLLKFGH